MCAWAIREIGVTKGLQPVKLKGCPVFPTEGYDIMEFSADNLAWTSRRGFSCGLMLLIAALQGCANTGVDESRGNDGPLNATYTVGGRTVTLVNGRAEVPAGPGASTKITTEIWGKPERSDLDGDGREDAALILVHDSGGSGTFYYVVAAIRGDGAYRGTAGVFLGDRIQPRTIGIVDNRITVEFLGRDPGDAFAEPPSVLMEQLAIYDPDTRQLAQVARDFEGEADPARMTLQMKTWYWVKTVYNDDTVHTPVKPDVFSLTFTQDGRLMVTTDCNTMRGSYRVDEHRIQFEQMLSTRMFCEGSQEQQFSKMLEGVNSYFFTNRGQLVLEIKYDSGSMIFR